MSKIDTSDIENKLRQIQAEVDSAAGAAKPAGIAVGTLLVAGAVGLSFVFGQHKAKKQTTVVEVRRQ